MILNFQTKLRIIILSKQYAIFGLIVTSAFLVQSKAINHWPECTSG